MGFDGEEDIQISGWTTTQSSIAFAGNPQPGPCINTSGNIDAQFLTDLRDPLTTTGTARVSNHLASAIAAGAFSHLLKISERRPRGATHLPNSATGGTGGGTTPWFGTATTTGGASLEVGDANLPLLAEHGLLKINREVVAEVIPLLRSSPALTTGSTSSTAKPAEKGFKDVSKATHIAHIGHATAATKPGLTELVIATTGLGIAQHLIGTTDLFKAVLSSSVFIDVGVILASHPPVCALQGVGICIPAHAKEVVVIGHQLVIPLRTLGKSFESFARLSRR